MLDAHPANGATCGRSDGSHRTKHVCLARQVDKGGLHGAPARSVPGLVGSCRIMRT